MADATAPYCTTADVAFFTTMTRGVKAQDFTPQSHPSEDVVSAIITSIASRIDMAYMSVGYQIPFTAITGETWPTAQTSFLLYLNTLGVVAYMGGNVASPPVTQPGRSRSTGSLFYDDWNNLIEQVSIIGEKNNRPTQALLRAQTYSDTGAEWRLSVSQPATSDYLEGYYDPTKYDLLHAYTERMQTFYKEMGELAPTSPDYLWIMHNRLGLTYAA